MASRAHAHEFATPAGARAGSPAAAAGVGCAVGAIAAILTVLLPAYGVVAVALGLSVVCTAAVLGHLRRLLLGAALLDIPFEWDKNFGFRPDVADLNALGGLSVSVTTIALVGLYAMWVARLLAFPEQTPRPNLRGAGAGLAFFALMVGSLLVAKDRTLAGFEIALVAELTLLFIYVASTVRTEGDIHFIVVMLLVGLALESLVALAIYATGGGFHIAGIVSHARAQQPGGGAYRVGGTVGSVNEAGSYFAFMTIVALAVFFSASGGLRRLALCSAVAGLIALVATLSRGGWIAFAVGITVLMFGLRGPRHLRIPRSALVGTAVVLTLAVIPLAGVVSARLTGSDHGAAAGRVPLMELAGRMIEDHPLTGVGANNFVVALPNYVDARFSADWITTVHNKYLLVWSEAGIGALIAFLLLIGGAIRRGFRGRHQDRPLLAGLSLGLAAALSGLAVHMNFDIFEGRPMMETLWLAAALVTAMTFGDGHEAHDANR